MRGSKGRNKGVREYLQGGERGRAREKRRFKMSHQWSECVECRIVAASLLHHTDKSRCESHCSQLQVVSGDKPPHNMIFLLPLSFSALHRSFSSVLPLCLCQHVCVCVRVPVLVFINNYLWEMK